MTMEFVDQESIRIGGQILPVRKTMGGQLTTVSADAMRHDSYNDVLGINNLRGVRRADIPLNFVLNIYRPIATAPGFEDYSLANFDGRKQFTLMYSFDFEPWYWQKSLRHFIDELTEQIKLTMANSIATKVDTEQEYILLWCDFELDDKSDCYEKFVQADREIHQLYTKILEADGRSAYEKATEPAIRWWLRHVVVPIISCGSVAALVSWYLLGG